MIMHEAPPAAHAGGKGASGDLETEQVRSVSPETIASIVALHIDALPDSSLTRRGSRVVRAFYEFVVRSPEERLFVVRGRDRVVLGAAVCSLQPRTIKNRLARDPRVAVALMLSLISVSVRRNSGTAAHSIDRGRRRADRRADQTEPALPEVLHIFAASQHRGLGVGRKLMHAIEENLRRERAAGLLVRTQSDPANGALRFYVALGYIAIADTTEDGKAMTLFEKRL
jgi:ribosomal protein S18 acetylase RimI-like enzyme